MKKCDAVMSKKTFCCLPDDDVAKAAKVMRSKNIGSLPVIETEKTRKLVGIVTDRDLTLKVVAEGLDTATTKVKSVMTTKVVTCRADDDMQDVLDAMKKHQIRRIVVVDKKENVLGIIAQADMAIRIDKPKKIASLMKRISKSYTK